MKVPRGILEPAQEERHVGSENAVVYVRLVKNKQVEIPQKTANAFLRQIVQQPCVRHIGRHQYHMTIIQNGKPVFTGHTSVNISDSKPIALGLLAPLAELIMNERLGRV